MTTATHTFHVEGMHCKSCVLMIESELKDIPSITRAHAHLKTCSVEVTGDFSNMSDDNIAQQLTTVLEKHGYRCAVEKKEHTKKWSEFKIAIPIALTFALLFVLLQKIGLINLVNVTSISYGGAFIIGVIASISSCMAVVGGLLLSMSATFAKNGDSIRPQLLFHSGRLVSFFVLGGLIGVLGSIFRLTNFATFILSLIIAIIMLILGINLLDIFHWTKKLQPATPTFISKHALGISKLNHALTPLLVGVATFFLPCGFTQSMQIATLSTGSYARGGFTMLAFALGTLPILALISFSSLRIHNHPNAGIFFKTAGLVVIMFALFNMLNSFVMIGLFSPIFNF